MGVNMEIHLTIKLTVKDGLVKSSKELGEWVNELDYSVTGYGIEETEIVDYDYFLHNRNDTF